ncbi:MAG: 23S rRNA (guanosine(2251)-2'-O)-methyltransferase RlmB [Clostridiales Family XIII bacterium]|nr:23S rRNA (guanosine(2251)-2'-O)-methyltransferase RlmB [Clostridiales Family XIII bacterium]
MKEGQGLIYGRNPVTEAIASGAGIEKILIQRNIEGAGKKIFSLAKKAGIAVQGVDKAALDRITGGVSHQGVAAYVSGFEYSDIESMLYLAESRGEKPFIAVLDGIEDPHNLGAIIRSAEGAGIHGVVIHKSRAVSMTPAAVKASAGASAHMKVARVANIKAALNTLQGKGLWVYGLDMGGKPYKEVDYTGGTALVVGSEGSGMSRLVKETCDVLVSIPMKGKVGSLNASNAAAIVFFEAASTRG